MTRRLLRWSAVLIALLVLLAGLLLGGVWYALNSEAGLRQLAALAQRFSGGALRIGAVQGRLLGEFALDEVHYAGADGTRADLKHLHLKLVRAELWQHRLHLQAAEVQGLALSLPPSPPDSGSGQTRLPSRLPFDLVIDGFSLQDFALRQGSEEDPFRIPDAVLVGSWIGDVVEVRRLDGTLDFTGALQLAGKARMSSDHIDFDSLSIKGPGQIEASGRFGLGHAASDLKLSWRELRWPLRGEAADVLIGGLDGGGSFSGRLDDYRYQLDTAALWRKLPLRLKSQGQGSLSQIGFAPLNVAVEKGTAEVSGTLAWSPALKADLKGTVSNLDPALFNADWAPPCAAKTTSKSARKPAACPPSVINATFDTHTTMQNGQPQIAFDASVERSQLRGYPLSLAAQGSTDTRSVRLQKFLLQSGQGSLSASGTAAWAPQLRADLEAQLQNFDPAQFAAAFKGNINGNLTAHTRDSGGKPDIAFGLAIDRSQLRGQPLRLDAAGDYRAGVVMLQKLMLAAGSTRLEASGQATPPFDLKGRLDSPELSALDPDLGGSAQMSFTLQGPLDGPHLVTQGKAQALRYGAYRVADIGWDADVDPARPSHIELHASEAQAGVLIHTLKLSVTGQETWHQAQLEVNSERGAMTLAVNGGYDRRKREWGGEIAGAHLAPQGLPPWNLQQGVGLLLGAQRQSLEPACFAGDGGRACLRLEQNVTREGLRLSLDLQRLLLGTFKPLLPKKYVLDGIINGNASLEYAHGDVDAMQVDLHTDSVRLQAPNAPLVEILPSSLKAEDRGGTLHALLDFKLPQGAVTADLNAAPAAGFQARPLGGSLRLSLPDLAFVQSFVPQLQKVSGAVEGELQFGGTIGLPRLQGRIALKEGSARVAAAGLQLEHVNLELSGQGEGALALNGSISSGGGSVSLSGTLDPSVAPPRADLRLQGKDFEALDTTDARIWITPDLHLLSDASGIHLDGSLAVPKADITPKGLGNNGVAVSEDQVIVGQEPTAEDAPLKIFSEIAVSLGDAVRFQGFGLTTRLEGAVTIREEPQRVATGQGELRLVEGRYQAYGQDLSIETGRLIFDGGAVTKPAVDLYATRKPQSDVTVGVRVRGTLDRPELSLQSEPSMPREQQLSWLVLGRSLDQSSSSDRSAVSEAALSLGLSGSDILAQKLGKKIGLDQISVGQSPVDGSLVAADATAIQGSQAQQNAGTSTAYTSQAAQLTLGKYLTPKLFVSYGVSLFQPGQTFRLLYDLGHGFKLQTESGVASGGDIIYTFERGH